MSVTIPFYVPRAQFFDRNGNPVSLGRVSFYEAGTSTLKAIYSDDTLTTPAPNPHMLDAGGWVQDGGVWLAAGTYKVVVEAATAGDDHFEISDASFVSANGLYERDADQSAIKGYPVWVNTASGWYASLRLDGDGNPLRYEISGSAQADGPIDQAPYVKDYTALWSPIGGWVPNPDKAFPPPLGCTAVSLSYYEVWTMDNIPGFPAPEGGILGFAVVPDITALRSLTPGAYGMVYVAGYYAPNDGGQGFFYWDSAASAADNSGTIISPAGAPATGRWLRSLSGAVTPNMFGAVPGLGSNVASNIVSMLTWCEANQEYRHVVMPAGEYGLNVSLVVTQDVYLELMEGVKFVPTDGAAGLTLNLSPAQLEIHGKSVITGGTLFPPTPSFSTIFTENLVGEAVYNRPEWYGADADGGDDSQAFQRLAGRDLQLSQVYSVTGSASTTFTHSAGNVMFEGNAALILGAPTTTFSITKVINQSIDTIFRGFMGGFRVAGAVRGSWYGLFSSGQILGSLWERMLTSITHDGTQRGTIVWDLPGGATYTFSSEPSAVSGWQLADHLWESSFLFDLNSFSVPFGRLATEHAVFDPAGAGVPLVVTASIDVRWWGARPNDVTAASSNPLAIQTAIETQEENRITSISSTNKPLITSQPVVGGGGCYWMDSGITKTYGVETHGMYLRDLTLSGTLAMDGETLIDVQDGGLLLEGVNLISKGTTRLIGVERTTQGSEMILKGVNLDASAQSNKLVYTRNVERVILSGCDIRSTYSLDIFGTESLTLDGCNFSGAGGSGVQVIQTAATRTRVTNCRFKSDTDFLTEARLIFSAVRGTFLANDVVQLRTQFLPLSLSSINQTWDISHNTFSSCIPELVNPSYATFSANRLIDTGGDVNPNLFITGTSGSPWIGTSLIIKDNIFDLAGTQTLAVPYLTNINETSTRVSMTGNVFGGAGTYSAGTAQTTTSYSRTFSTVQIGATPVGGLYGYVKADLSDEIVFADRQQPLDYRRVIVEEDDGTVSEGKLYCYFDEAPGSESKEILPSVWLFLGRTESLASDFSAPVTVKIVDLVVSDADKSRFV